VGVQYHGMSPLESFILKCYSNPNKLGNLHQLPMSTENEV